MMSAKSQPDAEWLGAFDSAKLTSRYFFTLFLMVLQEMFEYYDFYLVGYLVSALASVWHLTFGQSAIMLLCSGLGSMVGAPFFGCLADRFGRRPMIALGGVVFSVACAGCALLPENAWIEFSALRFLVGLGLGGAVTVQHALIVEITPTRHRTFLSSLMLAPVALGTFFSALLATELMPLIGWRGIVATGALPILISIAIWLWAPESVRWLMTRNRTEDARREAARQLGVVPAMVSLPATLAQPPAPASVSEVLRDRGRFWWVVAIWLGMSISTYGVQLWGPTIVSQLLRIPPNAAAAYFVALAVASFVGRLGFSLLPLRIGRRRSAQIMGYGSAVILLIAGLMNQQFIAGWSVFVLAIVLGAAIYSGGFANITPYTLEAFPVQLAARAFGLAQACNGVGRIVGPLFLALIAGSNNVISPKATVEALPTAFIFLAVCSGIAGFACSWFRLETHGKPLSLVAETEEKPAASVPLDTKQTQSSSNSKGYHRYEQIRSQP
jgi:MFS transporter, putative metabolite:H+ symporter